jgi:hypothetical protein
MELPILLAVDTTENWNKSDTALGESELALEIAGKREDESPLMYLLIGDGQPAGPNAARLRAKPDIIAALPEIILGLNTEDQRLQNVISQTRQALEADDRQLQTNINSAEQRIVVTTNAKLLQLEHYLQQNIENRETFHDDTLKGKGTRQNPLSVQISYDLSVAGIVAGAELVPDGTRRTFPLPGDFVFIRIVLVDINGIGQQAGADYTLDLDERTITFHETPESDDTITVYYTANE